MWLDRCNMLLSSSRPTARRCTSWAARPSKACATCWGTSGHAQVEYTYCFGVQIRNLGSHLQCSFESVVSPGLPRKACAACQGVAGVALYRFVAGLCTIITGMFTDNASLSAQRAKVFCNPMAGEVTAPQHALLFLQHQPPCIKLRER